jgi:hypothetical protein
LLKNARGANNAPLSQAQVNALKGASAQQVNSLYQAYDNAIFKAQTGFWSGAEVIYPASTLERAESGAFVPLSRLHSDATITQGNSASYDFWKNKPTEEIIESLKPGSAFGELTVKPSGTVMDGNTRIKVLEERGIDVNTLERVIIDLPKEPI